MGESVQKYAFPHEITFSGAQGARGRLRWGGGPCAPIGTTGFLWGLNRVCEGVSRFAPFGRPDLFLFVCGEFSSQ